MSNFQEGDINIQSNNVNPITIVIKNNDENVSVTCSNPTLLASQSEFFSHLIRNLEGSILELPETDVYPVRRLLFLYQLKTGLKLLFLKAAGLLVDVLTNSPRKKCIGWNPMWTKFAAKWCLKDYLDEYARFGKSHVDKILSMKEKKQKFSIQLSGICLPGMPTDYSQKLRIKGIKIADYTHIHCVCCTLYLNLS